MTFQDNIERAEQSIEGAGMTRRFTTTAYLENLTEGTTPAPWYTEDDGYGGFILLGSNPDRPYVYPHIGEMEEEADAKLAAASPELSAELHRVLTEFEERIRIWQKVAEKMDSNGDTDVGDAMRYMIRNITSILNGETNG